jgi:putative membrane protein
MGLAAAWVLWSSVPVRAHAGAPLAPHDLWAAWNWDLLLLASLALAGWLYGRGVATLWRRQGLGQGVRCWQVGAFAGGLAVLGVALISPLAALSGALFSAHMVQHLLLIIVAAPLLVLGAPAALWFWALPQPYRRPLARSRPWRWWQTSLVWLGNPLAATLLHALAVWLWHAPRLYEAALAAQWIHRLEHLAFLGSALLFWHGLLPRPGRGARGYGVGILMTFATAMQSGLLGALLTFARTPWYPTYGVSTWAWGLAPLADQQLAGVIMWAPAGGLYLVVTLVLLWLWLRSFEADLGDPPSLRQASARPQPVQE